MNKTGMDPDRYQMKDLKRRVIKLEKQLEQARVAVRKLQQEVFPLRAISDAAKMLASRPGEPFHLPPPE